MKRHPTDGVSLTFGLFFLCLCLWWLIARYVNVDLDIPHLGWIVAVGLIALGVAGVSASLRSGKGGDDPDTATPEPAGPAAWPTDPRL